MQRPLEGKLAIITGSSRGIGAAIARNLASKGASCILGFTSDSSAERTSSLASELQEAYDITALSVQADMGKPNGPAHIVNTAKNHFSHPRSGKFQIDIIVNNAGVAKNTALGDVTVEDFNWQYAVNVLGPILLVQAALPYLPTDRSGRVVNLSSTSASLGPIAQTVYAGTKGALEAMTRTWSRELSERATVNSVNPGPVATDMYRGADEAFQLHMKPFVQNTPLMKERRGNDEDKDVEAAAARFGGRLAYDYEIAGVVGMLCSEESAWCTGSVICANGGMKFSY
ncbi:MAG: hypothetical protein Q9163_005474 [Psora crenata]